MPLPSSTLSDSGPAALVCLTDEALVDLLDGRLSDEALAQAHRHAAGCAGCREVLASVTRGGLGVEPEGPERLEPTFISSHAPEVPWTPPDAFDEFRLERLLGRGGMGVVYLAHDTSLDRRVAVKFIASSQPEPHVRAYFKTEAQAIARLQHPNVVSVFRVGEVQGHPYIVSEYVVGRSLAQLPVPMPWRRVLTLALGLTRGLAAAHRQGVLHRDLKPSNALVTEDGEVKLLDFGLAERFEPGAASPSSSPRLVAGTLPYMAPELLERAPASPRSDLYSLGLVLHELCTGEVPRGMPRRLEEGASRAAGGHSIDPDFAALIARCLAAEPRERFASAEALCEALERLERMSASTPLTASNPYRGLAPFEAEHRALFFGRDGDIRAVLERLRYQPLVLVAGDSGVGKSSLCRAGVLPRVATGALDEGREYATVTLWPGHRPLEALAAALAPLLGRKEAELVTALVDTPAWLGQALREAHARGRGLLLFVDQLEELLTLSEPVQAAHFARLLGEFALPSAGVRVLLAARGDFLTRLCALPGLGEEAERALYSLRPLSPEGVCDAIVGPARARGVVFESSELVQTLVAATAHGADSLPRLQFTLTALWERRDPVGGRITRSALDEMGGVAGALPRHADGVLARLDPGEPEATRRLFVNPLDASPKPPWSVELLGSVRLLGPDGPLRVERRTAGLLAYLAVEGPTPRARLAGLLWPDSPESTARANLRQLLRRLRTTCGASLVEGTEQLAFTPGLEVDAARLRGHLRAGEHAAAARLRGQLLAGLEFDDAEALSEWLRGARAALDGQRLEAGLAEARRLQAEGALAAALEFARGALEVEPLSEEAHRMLMRLHYVAGDRGAALAAYERCRTLLREELGVEPLPETVALAQELMRAQRPPRPASRPIPLSVLRPPVLAGREREWALLERAWEAGQGIIVCGEPGVGKTRLMQDFLATKGPTRYYSGRPGDRAVPYGTHSRTHRELLEMLARQGAHPPAWVRHELARLIPELGEPPGPMRGEEDRLRLYHAKMELHRMAIQRGYDILGFDDLQYIDDASARAGHYVMAQLTGECRMRTFHCYRKGELPAEAEAIIQQGAAAGQFFLLELQPLDTAGVEGLLSGLGLPGVEGLGKQVARYTAGNPLFILETVKHLLETGELKHGLPENLPPPGKVGPIITSRLQRLSAPALQLARVLGVLREDFTLELAAVVLGAAPAELLRWWTELETAQAVRGAGFSHDLIGEAVVANTPPPVRVLLHHKVAEALEERGAPAARVADHWLQAGEPRRAAPALLRAAQHSRTALLPEADDFYSRAAALQSAD